MQQKYLHYHQENFINMSNLLVKIYFHLINNKFTYSPLGKAFDKQIKIIEDQGKKQVDALEKLKPKEETKPIKDAPNNQSRATIIFNDLINKRKKIMSELYDSADYKKLTFEYVGSTKDVSFYEQRDSKELFNGIKSLNLKFDDATEKSKRFLK